MYFQQQKSKADGKHAVVSIVPAKIQPEGVLSCVLMSCPTGFHSVCHSSYNLMAGSYSLFSHVCEADMKVCMKVLLTGDINLAVKARASGLACRKLPGSSGNTIDNLPHTRPELLKEFFPQVIFKSEKVLG